MQLDGHRLGSEVDQDAVANVRMMLQSLAQDVPVVAMAPVAPAYNAGGSTSITAAAAATGWNCRPWRTAKCRRWARSWA
jgi:hypothetical protein